MTGPGPTAAGADDEVVPMQLAQSWQEAEARLYPAVTTRPDVYQRVLLLVSTTVERLRALGPSTGALLAAAARGSDLVADVVADTGVSPVELDLELVARAALAMRHREVVAEQASRRRLRLVAEAHRAGRAWVVVEERGDPRGDVYVPYDRLEVRVAGGTGATPALLVTARADEAYRSVVHAVEPLRVDLATGAVLDVDDDGDTGATPTTHVDAAAREARVDALRGGPRDA